MQRRSLSMPRRSQCSRGELSQCKVTKKSSSAQISPIDKAQFSARIGAIFSKGGETENVALLLCCFVALSIVHTCMPSSLLSN